MLNRIRAAWHILRGDLPHREQVIAWAHDLGMHHGYLEPNCPHCYQASLDSYMRRCVRIFYKINRPDQIADFRRFLLQVVSPDNMITFHYNPAYVIAQFLGIEDDVELQKIEECSNGW